jgi:hypothetical protein
MNDKPSSAALTAAVVPRKVIKPSFVPSPRSNCKSVSEASVMPPEVVESVTRTPAGSASGSATRISLEAACEKMSDWSSIVA